MINGVRQSARHLLVSRPRSGQQTSAAATEDRTGGSVAIASATVLQSNNTVHMSASLARYREGGVYMEQVNKQALWASARPPLCTPFTLRLQAVTAMSRSLL